MENKKTIAQIARELGVSKEGVRKKMKAEPLATSLQQLVTTVGNTKYIEVGGIELIKSAFVQGKTPTELAKESPTFANKTPTNSDIHIHDSQVEKIEMLQAIIEELKADKEHYRAENNDLRQSVAKAQELADQAQQLHALAENKIKLLEAPQEKISWFKRKRS